MGLNYNTYCAQQGIGHTLMDFFHKKLYFQVCQVNHEGEMFRLAASFRERPSTPDAPPKPWLLKHDEVDLIFLEGYAGFEWKKRMFTALVLVAKFIQTRVGSEEGFIAVQHLRALGWAAVEGSHVFTCRGGCLVYLLAVIQVAALEERLRYVSPGSQSYHISVSIETFGAKSRNVVQFGKLPAGTYKDKANIIMKELQLRSTCVVNIIHRFSSFCANELHMTDPTKNNLFIGVGVSCRGENVFGDGPLYSTCPLSLVRERICRGCTNSSSEPINKRARIDPLTSDDDEEEAQVDDEHQKAVEHNGVIHSICEGFAIPEKGRTDVVFTDSNQCHWRVDPYPTYFFIIPSNLNPFTAKMRYSDVLRMSLMFLCSAFTVKLQTYCGEARNAFGESHFMSEGHAMTALVGACLKGLSLIAVASSQIADGHPAVVLRSDHALGHLNECHRYAKMNAEHIRRNGATGRIEITYKSTRLNDHSDSFIDAFADLLEIFHATMMHYSIANEVATCFEFATQGIRTRTDFVLSQLHPSTADAARMTETLSYLVEEVGHWQRAYTGINMFGSRAAICRRFTVAASRPIFSQLPSYINERLALHSKNPKRWIGRFGEILGMNLVEPVNIKTRPAYDITKHYVATGFACRHCGHIFKSTAIEHACIRMPPFIPDDRVTILSQPFINHIASMYNSLNQYQRVFVDTAVDKLAEPLSLFLTGFAGCGKTRTLNCVIAKLVHKVGVNRVLSISYTKSAANEVHGSSIHALFNLGLGRLNALTHDEAVSAVMRDKDKALALVQAHTLIIDEVSLLTGTALDLIDKTLRSLRGNIYVPFGGVRVILCGDVLQLPPILDDEDKKIEGIAQYFFESKAWYEDNFLVCYLHHIYRQTQMTDLLNRIRDGEPTENDIDTINNYCGTEVSKTAVKFLIDQMADLNVKESKDETITNPKKKRRVCDNLQWKANKHFRPGRVGEYSNNSDPKSLIPVRSEHLADELNERPLLDDQDGPEVHKKLMSSFIVGVENVESAQFSSAMESISKFVDEMNPRDVYYSESTDTYYHVPLPLTEKALKKVEDSIEGNTFRDEQWAIPEDYFRGFSSQAKNYRSIREKWSKSNSQSRCNRMLLYKGQTVIFTSNSISNHVANNTQGVIEELVYDETDVNKVKLLRIRKIGDSHLKQPIVEVVRDRCKFCSESTYIDKDKKMQVIGVREQFPIKPACWATAYAVQGMTLEESVVLFFNNIRLSDEAYGYLYVLISRLRDIKNFCPLRKIHWKDIIAHPLALAFDKIHRAKGIETNELHRVDYNITMLKEAAKEINEKNKKKRRL